MDLFFQKAGNYLVFYDGRGWSGYLDYQITFILGHPRYQRSVTRTLY